MNTVDMIPDFHPILEEGVLSEERIAQLYLELASFGEYELIQKESFGVMRSVVMANIGIQPRSDADIKEAIRPSLKPGFRLRLADEGSALKPCIDDLFYNPHWLQKARDFMGAKLIKPQYIMVNICVAAEAYDRGHIDTPCFRGFGPDQNTSWLRQAMGRSGLFEPWRRNFGNFIFWLYQDEFSGNFQYWARGIHEAPDEISTPYNNKGLWAQNTKLFHRAVSLGLPAERETILKLDFDSTLTAADAAAQVWHINNGDQILASYPREKLRILFHWDFEAFDNLEQLRYSENPSSHLSVKEMYNIFRDDLAIRGVNIASSSDPLSDETFKKQVTENYQMAPSIVPDHS